METGKGSYFTRHKKTIWISAIAAVLLVVLIGFTLWFVLAPPWSKKCSGSGKDCNSSTDCCSGECIENKCCLGVNQKCTSDAQCCFSSSCRDGHCVSPECNTGGILIPKTTKCMCRDGYKGDQCQFSRDNFCNGNGDVIEVVGQHACRCDADWSGIKCDTKSSFVCQNGGTVYDNPKYIPTDSSSYPKLCDCSKTKDSKGNAFIGNLCQYSDGLQCNGTGKVILAGDGSPKCVCDNGWGGEDCSQYNYNPPVDIDCERITSETPITPEGNNVYCLKDVMNGNMSVCGTKSNGTVEGNWIMTRMCGAGSSKDCFGGYGAYKCVRLPDFLEVEDQEVLSRGYDFAKECKDGYVLAGNCNSGANTDCTCEGTKEGCTVRGNLLCNKYKGVATINKTGWEFGTSMFWGKDYSAKPSAKDAKNDTKAIVGCCNGGANASDCFNSSSFVVNKVADIKIGAAGLCNADSDCAPVDGVKRYCLKNAEDGVSRCETLLVKDQKCSLTDDRCGHNLKCTKGNSGFQTWQKCTPVQSTD